MIGMFCRRAWVYCFFWCRYHAFIAHIMPLPLYMCYWFMYVFMPSNSLHNHMSPAWSLYDNLSYLLCKFKLTYPHATVYVYAAYLCSIYFIAIWIYAQPFDSMPKFLWSSSVNTYEGVVHIGLPSTWNALVSLLAVCLWSNIIILTVFIKVQVLPYSTGINLVCLLE